MSRPEVNRRQVLEISGVLGLAAAIELHLTIPSPTEDRVKPQAADTSRRPNVVLIMADDMGFSDLGCYGSEIATPHLNALADNGVRMSQFYNTARCSPARASLLTGLHPHQTGIGVLTHNDGPGGYPGTINNRCLTMAEVLGSQGYTTAIRGKWHLAGQTGKVNDAWPTRRGFDSYFGILAGAASYYDPNTLTRDEQPVDDLPEDFYLTSALGEEAADFVRGHAATTDAAPFFLYLPFTAPHWPLHAPEAAVQRQQGRYDRGWDQLRAERYRRLVAAGLIDDQWALSDRDPDVVAWQDTANKEWQARRMEVYAAQVELLDAAVGQLVAALKETGEFDNTLIMFLSDNGGCAEEIAPAWADKGATPGHTPKRSRSGERVFRGNTPTVSPGGPATFASYGKPWANLSNTPFREYKRWVHEGGIATPFIAHWPNGDLRTGIDHTPHQLPDVLATVLEATGTQYPTSFPDRDPLPLEGESMLGSWQGDPAREREAAGPRQLFFEHLGNCAVREGRWKLVRMYRGPWELYDLATDRTELHDLSVQHPERVSAMSAAWEKWADRCGVKPREQVIAAAAEDRPAKGIGFVVDDLKSSESAPA